jgi:hypothetical protein
VHAVASSKRRARYLFFVGPFFIFAGGASIDRASRHASGSA